MPKTIIVPLDGSDFAERALGPAAVLATRTSAELVLVTSPVVELEGDPHAYLVGAAERSGIAPVERVVADRATADAVRVVVEASPDPVVCMTTHGRSGIGHALIGSVAESILREVAVPMLLVGPAVRPQLATRFDNVVVCTDGSETAEAAVPVVAPWIQALDLRSWVVQVVDPDAQRTVMRTGGDLAEAALVRRVADELATADGGRPAWEVLHGGDVARAILDFADGMPASLIAMATHGRTGLARVALGSIAMSVVHDATCPVLVVRPDGLVAE